MIFAAVAAGSSAETFTELMDHVAQGFEAVGAAILVVGVMSLWSTMMVIIQAHGSGGG